MTRKRRITMASSIVVGLLFVVHFVSLSPDGLWLRTFYDSLHVPVFGVIAICILLVTPEHWGPRNRIVVTFTVVVGLSLLSELAQVPTNRDASFDDIISDWLGAAGFVCIASVFSRSLSIAKSRRGYLVLLGIVFITWPLLPLAKVSVAYAERAQMLPSLTRFDSRFAAILYQTQNAELTKQKNNKSGSVSANILLQDGRWPGISFNELWPNWQPYDELIIGLENPGTDKLAINVRVHDREHRGDQRYDDRFNRRVELAPGFQQIRIKLADVRDAPSSRQMNMANIEGLILFATNSETGRRFVLHEIRLD